MPGSCSGTWTHGPAKVPQADSLGLSVLQKLREEFLRLVRTGKPQPGPVSISAEELAKHWHSLAENAHARQGQGSLILKEKQVIALRVSQALQEMDLNGNASIDMDEWVHHMLLKQSSVPTVRASQHINAMLKVALHEHPRILHDLQRMFEVADASHTASLSQEDIADVYNRRLWRLRAADDGSMLSDADFRDNDVDQLAWELVEAMDIDNDERISYGEFMAYCVGRRKREVILHMYDLSSGAASSISPYLLGERLGGIWHTGIVVFGKEYYFGGEIYYDTPGRTCFGIPAKRIPLGNTLWRQEELHEKIVKELKSIYCREAYDVIFHNCNHFSNHICEWLTGHTLPDEVLKQPEKLMQCVFTRAARPLLNRWLIGFEGENQTSLKDGVSGGSTSSTTGALQDAMRPGMVVAIQPASGEGPAVLGAVMTPRGASEEASRTSGSKKDTEKLYSNAAHCWVRYFGVPTLSTRGCRGVVETELLPRDRLTVVRLSDLGAANAAYQAALGVMMAPTLSDQALGRAGQEVQQPLPSCTPSSAGGNRKGAGGASRGLSPASTMVPESMLEGSSSPRVSENSSDQPGLEEKLEGLAAELCISREDLKSLVLEDFLPEDWMKEHAAGISEASVEACFDGEPILERLPDVLQVASERKAAQDWPPADWPPAPWPSKREPFVGQPPVEKAPEETPREEHPLLMATQPGPAEWLDMEWAEEVREPASDDASAAACVKSV
mmetsp:Transcript_106116/g.204231  ORF Transcript_106116/g.204231 Transcript_106116/m.204231 type:complete len:728 (-) Transcript_106116:10-2193(-)